MTGLRHAAGKWTFKEVVGHLIDDERIFAHRALALALFAGLPEAAWSRRGMVNGYEATVRGLAFHIAGHELRHLAALEGKYLARTG